MKKLLFALFLTLGFTLGANAQTEQDSDYSKLNLTKGQSEKIKEINRDFDYKFRAVGQDKSLSGSQKGAKKKALALDKERKIKEVIDSPQLVPMEKIKDAEYSYKLEQSSERALTKNEAVKRIDKQIKQAEDTYNSDLENLKSSARSKEEFKRRKNSLHDEYKRRKARLKTEKDAIKANY